MRDDLIGFYQQILVFVTSGGIARHLEINRRRRRELLVHLLYFEGITERNGVEDCFKVVVAVRPFCNNV